MLLRYFRSFFPSEIFLDSYVVAFTTSCSASVVVMIMTPAFSFDSRMQLICVFCVSSLPCVVGSLDYEKPNTEQHLQYIHMWVF